MKKPSRAGGWHSIAYTFRTAARVGWTRLWKAMNARNACKTCAVGMGGQNGGMRNELGRWPEVCKKSLQAMAADMQPVVPAEFFRRFSIEELRGFTPRELEHAGRLGIPLYAGPDDSHYRPLNWEDALDRIASKLRSTAPDKAFFYSSGRSSNEAGFLLQIMARCFGTNHVNNCSYYCHQASGVGLTDSIGTATATVSLEDVEHADLFILIGGNPASNHPRLMTTFMKLKRAGGKLMVINPMREVGLMNFSVPSDARSLLFGTKMADLYVQPNIGGDIAFLTGVAKRLMEIGAYSEDFLRESTSGWDAYRDHLSTVNWDEILRGSGVSREIIEQAAELYARADRAVFGWTMGITHHLHGVANVQTIANLALMRGMVGKPHAGLLPIRGHSNVQGVGTVGVAPALKQAVFDRLTLMGLAPPASKGYDTMSCIEAADRGDMRFGFCLGGNLFGSNPHAEYARRALGRLDMVVYLSTSLNTGHAHGTARETLILPVRARDEESQPTTQESMFSFVRLSDGGPPRIPGVRGEVEVIAGLADRLFAGSSPVQWAKMKNHSEIRRMIARAIPGMEHIEGMDETRNEFEIPGRIHHEPRFATADGRAKFMVHPIPNGGRPSERELRLMTVRSEGQFNTVVYEEEDVFRGVDRRDVILLNALDVARLGLAENQRVTVRSSSGTMKNILVRIFDVREGNAVMYYPEANVLTSQEVDPLSRTPAFKSTRITLEPLHT